MGYSAGEQLINQETKSARSDENTS
uniref:Uncharacterized protein n=1 Tax=Anguilla anguilla TaxID=7936 RepID=A0A0E9SAJ2_ANGAN